VNDSHQFNSFGELMISTFYENALWLTLAMAIIGELISSCFMKNDGNGLQLTLTL
jgi:hypothetical protein